MLTFSNEYFLYNIRFITVDNTAPSVNSCPSDITVSTELGTEGAHVSWNNPLVTDASGIIELNSTHSPGQLFPVGVTQVNYHFQDGSSNYAECIFMVSVETGKKTVFNINILGRILKRCLTLITD